MNRVLLDRANKAFVQAGTGLPDSDTRGNIYLDLATSTLYVRVNPDDPWTEISGGGGGDSLWERNATHELLEPITGTDTILVGPGKIASGSFHPGLEFRGPDGSTGTGFSYTESPRQILVSVDTIPKAYFDEEGFKVCSSVGSLVSGCNSAANVDIDTGTEYVDYFNPATDGSCMWHYFVGQGANIRAGIICCAWDFSEEDLTFNESATSSLGDTSDLTFSIDFSSPSLILKATAASDNWSVKVFRIKIE